MKTALFNLHEISTSNGSVIIEFYAGDIFDVSSDILILSAFKDNFFPKPGTIWGSLFLKTKISFLGDVSSKSQRVSENIVSFNTRENPYFKKLVALELADVNRIKNFTTASFSSRYQELLDFLESYPTVSDESISMPLLGTGNQGISLEDSVIHLLRSLSQLQQTKLKIIRVFAYDFKAIGVLNKTLVGIVLFLSSQWDGS